MTTVALDKKQIKIIADIPAINDFSKFYFYLAESNLGYEYLDILNKTIGLNDKILSEWLNVSEKTYRNYKKNQDVNLKDNIKEHIVILLALYKHGVEIFDNLEQFENWLKTNNRLLDNKAPQDFLDTILGVKFIDNRLTAIEYGENA